MNIKISDIILIFLENIIIYGMDLDVISTIQTLIKFGIDSKRITVFCNRNTIKCLNNPFMNEKIQQIFKELKINIHESFQMQEWNDGQWSSGKPIQKVYFIKQKNHEEDDIQSPRKLTMNCCVNIVLLKFLN